eukprot:Lankesteria_metandrocarpae@DN3353_c0_g1_i2.p1
MSRHVAQQQPLLQPFHQQKQQQLFAPLKRIEFRAPHELRVRSHASTNNPIQHEPHPHHVQQPYHIPQPQPQHILLLQPPPPPQHVLQQSPPKPPPPKPPPPPHPQHVLQQPPQHGDSGSSHIHVNIYGNSSGSACDENAPPRHRNNYSTPPLVNFGQARSQPARQRQRQYSDALQHQLYQKQQYGHHIAYNNNNSPRTDKFADGNRGHVLSAAAQHFNAQRPGIRPQRQQHYN